MASHLLLPVIVSSSRRRSASDGVQPVSAIPRPGQVQYQGGAPGPRRARLCSRACPRRAGTAEGQY